MALERAFRSIIDISKGGRPTIDREELLENFRSFQRSHIRNEQESFKKIYSRIQDHFRRHVEVPSYERLMDHFQEEPGCEEVVITLDRILGEKPHIGGNYKDILLEIEDRQDLEVLQECLTETNEIATNGRTVGKARMKGVESALDYFASKSREIRSNRQDYKTEAEITNSKEISLAKDNYIKKSQNQSNSIGIYFGIDPIDDARNGIKATELVIVGAYSGQGKTTFSMNTLYRALLSGWDSLLVTLEMTLEEMQTMLYVLHTSSPDIWVGTEFQSLIGKIDYNAAFEGRLNAAEQKFYFAAMDDLDNNEGYGKLHIYQPDKTNTSVKDIELKCLEINSELKTSGRILDFLVVDYIRLLSPDEKSRDDRVDLNNIIKSLKKLCISFNHGQGIRCLSPHQMKRQGFERALSNGGIYLLTDLSDTSEIEKSGDLVIALFMDDALRKSGLTKICCLKDRRNAPFNPFEACANLASKYMYTKSDLTQDDFKNFGEVGLVLEGA